MAMKPSAHSRPSLIGVAMAAFLAAACGEGFSDEPFQTGAIEGQISGEFGPDTEVFVFGSPELRAKVAADGSWRIEQIPVGEVEVLAIDPAGRAARLPVEVRPGALARPQALPLPFAGRTRVAVESVGYGNMTGATVEVEGTTLTAIAESDGTAALGPLPEGCYVMRVFREGHSVERAPTCRAQAEEKRVSVQLKIDEKAAERGCVKTGCTRSLTCDAGSGLCYACLSENDCAPGLSCSAGLCVIPDGHPAPSCAGCETDLECGFGARCDTFSPPGEPAAKFCSFETGCTVNAECPFGTRCDAGRCREDDRKFAVCGASSSGMGATCQGATSSECKDLGLLTGVCSGLVCTMECDGVTAICPAGWSCQNSLCERN